MRGREDGETMNALSVELESPWEVQDALREMLAILEYELSFRGGTDGEYCGPGRIVSAR